MLIDKETASRYNWGALCESYVLVDSAGLSIKQKVMPPGTKEQMHFHSEAQQLFFILKGEATFWLDDELFAIGTHKGIYVQPEQKHYIENKSNEELEFLVISQPATTNDRTNIE